MHIVEIELSELKTNGSDALESLVTTGNGDNHPTGCEETSGLLGAQRNGCNGETMPSERVATEEISSSKESAVDRVKRELKKVVCGGKVRLWMVLLMLLVVLVAVILISLSLCSVVYRDPDEKFNRSTFRVPRLFNGSFVLPGLNFTEDLLSFSSNRSRDLTGDLQGKLSNVYTSSPALGRYFSKAEIHTLRNGSVIAEYQLTFFMPEEHQEQLRNFTLSRKMVYNVLRQFLYAQDRAAPSALYIDPVSLKLS
ncbi:TPA-induced transmembrane protein-like [Syngnathus typhle]|uniref:TPA-induced transmembrane protein-like n=1 Tax=Syngnathus typhle TaxID=161592 RepID=UPI002A69B33B|nr:TPA-induced transmembrane protein-like [Syngnathus typhle]XP_061137228.1 TPA-induced transmembrane protein-like [Syngnathus typhle]